MTDSFEEIEALAVADILRRGGVAVSLVALDAGGESGESGVAGGENGENGVDFGGADGENSNLTDGADFGANGAKIAPATTPPKREIIGAHGIRVVCDLAFGEANFADYAAIILPGGMPAAQTLAQSARVGAVLREFFGAGKLVCAICAAAWALGAAGVLRGEFSCYDGFDAPAIAAHEAFFAAAGVQNFATKSASNSHLNADETPAKSALNVPNSNLNATATANSNSNAHFSLNSNLGATAQKTANSNLNAGENLAQSPQSPQSAPIAKPLGELAPRYNPRGVSVSGRQITAKSPAFALDFAFAILRALRGEAVVRDVRAGMLFAD